MTRHEPIVSIGHMLDHAREARDLLKDRHRAELDRDRLLNLAMVRLMEVIGEAARRVPEVLRDQYPDVPWRDIADLRNRLIHGYDTINFDLLWTIVNKDLPLLIAQLEQIIAREGDSESCNEQGH